MSVPSDLPPRTKLAAALADPPDWAWLKDGVLGPTLVGLMFPPPGEPGRFRMSFAPWNRFDLAAFGTVFGLAAFPLLQAEAVGALIALVVAFMVAFVAFRLLGTSVQRAASRAWAQATGWGQETGAAGWQWPQIAHPPLFGADHDQHVTDVLHGQYQGRDCVAYEHFYTEVQRVATSNGSSGQLAVFQYQVVAVPLPVHVPLVTVSRQSAVGVVLGRQDINFESAAFNERWQVQADYPKVAFDVLTPRAMQLLLDSDIPGINVRYDGAWVMAWWPTSGAAERLTPTIELLSGLADLIPQFLVDDLNAIWG